MIPGKRKVKLADLFFLLEKLSVYNLPINVFFTRN